MNNLCNDVPNRLADCWKPMRNPGSMEDNQQTDEYWKHLTYHGGLNTNVWRREEGDSLIQIDGKQGGDWMMNDSFVNSRKDFNQTLSNVDTQQEKDLLTTQIDSLKCLWKVDNLIVESVIISSSQSSCHSCPYKEEKEKTTTDPPIIVKTEKKNLSDRLGAWLFLSIFLTLVVLHRVYVIPNKQSICQ